MNINDYLNRCDKHRETKHKQERAKRLQQYQEDKDKVSEKMDCPMGLKDNDGW